MSRVTKIGAFLAVLVSAGFQFLHLWLLIEMLKSSIHSGLNQGVAYSLSCFAIGMSKIGPVAVVSLNRARLTYFPIVGMMAAALLIGLSDLRNV